MECLREGTPANAEMSNILGITLQLFGESVRRVTLDSLHGSKIDWPSLDVFDQAKA